MISGAASVSAMKPSFAPFTSGPAPCANAPAGRFIFAAASKAAVPAASFRNSRRSIRRFEMLVPFHRAIKNPEFLRVVPRIAAFIGSAFRPLPIQVSCHWRDAGFSAPMRDDGTCNSSDRCQLPIRRARFRAQLPALCALQTLRFIEISRAVDGEIRGGVPSRLVTLGETAAARIGDTRPAVLRRHDRVR